MKYLIDAYAWVEYLEGSKLGERVREVILDDNELFSLNLTIAEVVSKVKRKGGNIDVAYNAVSSNSKIIEINPIVSKEAGIFHAKIRKKIKNFGLVDSILLVVARNMGAKILTGDNHFKNFKEAVFV